MVGIISAYYSKLIPSAQCVAHCVLCACSVMCTADERFRQKNAKCDFGVSRHCRDARERKRKRVLLKDHWLYYYYMGFGCTADIFIENNWSNIFWALTLPSFFYVRVSVCVYSRAASWGFFFIASAHLFHIATQWWLLMKRINFLYIVVFHTHTYIVVVVWCNKTNFTIYVDEFLCANAFPTSTILWYVPKNFCHQQHHSRRKKTVNVIYKKRPNIDVFACKNNWQR